MGMSYNGNNKDPCLSCNAAAETAAAAPPSHSCPMMLHPLSGESCQVKIPNNQAFITSATPACLLLLLVLAKNGLWWLVVAAVVQSLQHQIT